MNADVIVVGGGFAGLSAATALAKRGARVVVVDARPQLGGRATAFLDRDTGELVDNGQHVMFGCYSATLAFLGRIGAMDNVRVMPALEVPYIDTLGRRSVLRCPPLPSPLHLVGAVLDWDPMPWRERLSILRLVQPIRGAATLLRKEGGLPPFSATVSEWLRAHGQGPKLTAWLWEPLAVAALNQRPEVASAAPFVRVLAEMFGPDTSASAMVLPTRPLHQMYAEPARDYLVERGSETRSKALARLIFSGNRVEGVDVRGERTLSPVVISTVPWHSLRALVGAAPPPSLAPLLDVADSMTSMPIVTVNLWYDRVVMDDLFVGLPGRNMQWVFDKRRAFGSAASHLSTVSSGATDLTRMTRDDLIALAAKEIADALPRARRATLVRATVISEKQATFSLAPDQPPRPGMRTGVEGLYLAGDWMDTGLPGTIESAVRSGHGAAELVNW
jgi:squalene-associated FAD-dependent desaturase